LYFFAVLVFAVSLFSAVEGRFALALWAVALDTEIYVEPGVALSAQFPVRALVCVITAPWILVVGCVSFHGISEIQGSSHQLLQGEAEVCG
jgi:hypothetical protein